MGDLSSRFGAIRPTRTVIRSVARLRDGATSGFRHAEVLVCARGTGFEMERGAFLVV
jgi:hypothetical protein